jgi:endonuclease/exonuclease/phosphatase family metal-dependent hydrolase
MEEKLVLNILSYNLFHGEDEIQSNYINDNNFDIIFLQETSENINLQNYYGDKIKSHCGYTYLGINKNVKFTVLSTFKCYGIIISHVIINNIQIIIGSLHLHWGKDGSTHRLYQLDSINKLLIDKKLNHLPIILGGDTNMREHEKFDKFYDIYLLNKNKSLYLTYPNREFKDSRITFVTEYNFRFDKFFIKNCNFRNFETISNVSSDHLAIKTTIVISKTIQTVI